MQGSTKTVAIFGGSFDPPTIAHMEIGKRVLSDNLADTVIYIPCGPREDKPSLTDGELRIEMLSASLKCYFGYELKVIRSTNPNALDGKEKIVIDDYEVRVAKQLVRTAILIPHYETMYPGIRFVFVTGSDVVPSFKPRPLYEEVLKKKEYLIFVRDNDNAQSQKVLPNSKIIPDIGICGMSSTRVREVFAQIKSFDAGLQEEHLVELRKYICDDVIRVVITHGLYT